MEMVDHAQRQGPWPAAGVLAVCALALGAGYVAAILRGPAQPQEVRVVAMPEHPPAPSLPAE